MERRNKHSHAQTSEWARTEVAVVGEVLAEEFILLDTEGGLEDLHCLLTLDSDPGGDALVAADAEASDGEAGF